MTKGAGGPAVGQQDRRVRQGLGRQVAQPRQHPRRQVFEEGPPGGHGAPARTFTPVVDPEPRVARHHPVALRGRRIGGPVLTDEHLDWYEEALRAPGFSESMLEALRVCGPQVAARRALVAAERRRILDALHDLPTNAPPSQTNSLWLGAAGLTAPELAARLGRSGVIVAQGGDLGDDTRVRVTVQSGPATDRLLDALRQALG